MRIVVKVGTSTLAYATGRLNIRHTEKLVEVLSDLKNEGHEVILVSSGAIGMGVGKLNLPGRPKDMPTKQAAAAVGQCELMYTYDRLFSAYDHTVAQILLTGVDVEHTERRVNIQNTLTRLLELGALPIINENDSVATDEITSIGDNDTLAAIVACCCKADLLVLLSDIDGLYTANPHTHPDAALIPLVEEITPEVMALADGAGSCSRAEDGARIAAEITAQLLARDAQQLESLEDTDIRYHVLMTVRMALDEYCWDEDVYLKDVGSTLLAAAATQNNLLVIHLGDGWIAQTDDAQNRTFLSLPENGRRRNQTYLTSMIPVLEHVRVQRIPIQHMDAVTLFSDGWEKEQVRYDFAEIDAALERGEVAEPHVDDVSAIRMARKKSSPMA